MPNVISPLKRFLFGTNDVGLPKTTRPLSRPQPTTTDPSQRLEEFAAQVTPPGAIPFERYQGRDAGASKLIHREVMRNPAGFRTLNDWIHGRLPRGQLSQAAWSQGFPTDNIMPRAGIKMLRERQPPSPPRLLPAELTDGQQAFGRGVNGLMPPRAVLNTSSGKNLFMGGFPLVYNHEILEHGGQMKPESVEDLWHPNIERQPEWQATGEIPASLGDMVFGAEMANRTLGTPLRHEVKYPGGKLTHDIQWMVNQAKQHGYFKGRSMTDLLATPEGLQYLKMLARDASGSAFH